MEMKQCSNGHFYDASKFSECPNCNSSSANVNMTRPLEVGPTMPVSRGAESVDSGSSGHTYSMATPNKGASADRERTVALIKHKTGIDPVVGWLVCVAGTDKGRDYRIHSDNNAIGRSETMDICIHGDNTISRENHAFISFDAKDKIFYFRPGDGRSIVRFNGKALFNTTEIAPYDVIELGETKLIFVPLCGERFDWSE
jgi:hypothetical protein